MIWLALLACGGADTFVGQRLPVLCAENYATCSVTAGCALDAQHYVEGTFPGARRVVVFSEEEDTEFRVRLYLETADAPGTELVVQMYEPDCTLNTSDARVHLEDVDIIQEAGQDRTLVFEDLVVEQPGEQLLGPRSGPPPALALAAPGLAHAVGVPALALGEAQERRVGGEVAVVQVGRQAAGRGLLRAVAPLGVPAELTIQKGRQGSLN